MKGIVPIGDCKIEVRDFEIPEPGENQVLIDVKSVGICGSDIHTFRMTWEQIGERQNLIMGHEAGGIVYKIGKCVNNVKVGDRVCIYHYIGCGKCAYCHEGIFGWCENKRAYGWGMHGTMSEYILAEEKYCCPFPKELPFEDATFMACSAGTGYAALKKLDDFASDGYIAVVGLGPIGIVACMLAQAKGWKTIAFDISKKRVDFAVKHGINAFCPDKDKPLVKQIKDRMSGKQPVRIFDTSGHPEGLADAIDIAGNGAHLAVIGRGRRKYKMSDRMDISELVVKQITFRGSWVFTLPEYYELSEFMLANRLSFNSIVTSRYDFSDAQKAFEIAADINNAGKTVFIKD